MRTIKCDICGREIYSDAIKVEFLDGEHPHCGSTMHKTADVCIKCLEHIELSSNEEFDDVVKRLKVK